MLRPNLEVVLRANHISVRNLDSGRCASAEAPFSCSHLLVDDVDILEHAMHQLLRELASSWWLFPRVTVSTAGRAIHSLERRIIRDALQNAGASQVVLDPTILSCDEERSSQRAYIEKAMRKR